LLAPVLALAATGPTAPPTPLRCWALLELEDRLRWALEARGLVAAACGAERWRAELEAARRLRTEDAFELLRAEPAFELLRAAEVELLRAAGFELLRAGLELAAVAPASLAAGRLRLAAFGGVLCFVLSCLATVGLTLRQG
jgi:hypothetical protein